MLREFSIIRADLRSPEFFPEARRIRGGVVVASTNIELLRVLQDGGLLEATDHDGSVDFSLLEEPFGAHLVSVELNCLHLPYYESIEILIAEERVSEPFQYYVHGIGHLASRDQEVPPQIDWFRTMLRARKLLESTADYTTPTKALFMAPERLEIPFICRVQDLGPLPELIGLEAQFAAGSVEREQRLALFKRSLREHLRPHDTDLHFGVFLRVFSSIYDTYIRDYDLWLGNTFGDLEKSFEEKRLKFIADLNNILASVQASILAVPIAALLVGDKYDVANPLKNFLLAVGIASVGVIALKLLTNQAHTLNAVSAAIDSVKHDFKTKQPQRKTEFKTRLEALDHQEARVRVLLTQMRRGIVAIIGLGGIAWCYSFTKWVF